MKTFKRNAVIITVLIFVAAAVYLNWSYGNEDGKTEVETDVTPSVTDSGSDDAQKTPDESGGAGLYYGENASEVSGGAENGEYFDSVRLTRTQARDSAAAALAAVSEAEGASAEVINDALSRMAQLAEHSVLEAELEALKKAKGFSECVVYISDAGVTVTVPRETTEGLTSAAVARITDINTDKTSFTAGELNIVEIK